jgi:hypothetical protein
MGKKKKFAFWKKIGKHEPLKKCYLNKELLLCE